MSALPESLIKLIDLLSDFPGIGKKTAERMAFFILKKKTVWATELSNILVKVKENIHECPICNNISETSPCMICVDESRDDKVICLVEDTIDLITFEKTGFYKGKYHVLGGLLSPLDGVGPENLNINSLSNRIDSINELIIATNPSSEGETTALYISELYKDKDIKISRLARGIPVGGDLEYTDEATLISAIEGRREI
tara:strand:- start:1822 stop:2415 length:594 start_codon:yes stop_codon:yes gene_type:complete